ncbi:MAG: 30S ribosomal protein S8 [Candidatus Sericytochromatia bacterium]|nr:30S ribosomal protein S8 [Candidatus Sericytochromatia bacterium]
MGMTDPIADMLTRIRNASKVRHVDVTLPGSTIKTELARVLTEEGYITGYEEIEATPAKQLKLVLKYSTPAQNVISGIRRISKPGLRVYVGKHDVPRVLGGLGIAVISTSQGVMTDRKARAAGIGGEVLCYVW